ncbi:MAG: TonB-dependent receptor [Tannerellaceae bacterium]|nr:TonB-dependent receptor [Tannerellaceae bacterium]
MRRSTTTLFDKNRNYHKPTQQYSLNYNNTFWSKHDLGAMLLWEMYHDRTNWVDGEKEFTIGVIPDLNFGSSTNQKASGLTQETAHEGLVGRLNYTYDNRYLLEFNFRYDGSYKFSSDNRWGFFPGISAGWRISEKKFFKNLLPDMDNLKVRASYAKVGDEGDFDAYQYLAGFVSDSRYVMGVNTVVEGMKDRGVPNPWLTWYESKIKNIGFEASWKRGLITLEMDFFQRNRSGLPATRTESLPTIFGQAMPQENLNSDKNKGFEISVGHNNQIGEVRYNVNANFSATRIIEDHVEREASSNMYENWLYNTNGRYKDIRWGKKVIGSLLRMKKF